MSSSPPTTLGQYQIIREIARSNDIVYEAYDPLMNRRVAVKELAVPAGLSAQQREERVHRFKREAQAAGTLNHASIMTVYSFAEDAGRHFMAMEYLDGCTLRNEIDTKGFLPSERAIKVAIAVLEGLSHAHSKGVIHRDIKPDNIQLLSNGQIKITDFGIARLTFQPNLTMDGQVFGTPSYMSPEQVVGKEIDQRSDLFSVAIVLYEMVSGQKPFTGDSVVTISYAIMNKDPQQPTQMGYELWSVVRKALDKTPQMRYQNADEFIQALRDTTRLHADPTPAQAPPIYNYGAPVAAPPINAPVPMTYGHNPFQQPNQAFPAPQPVPAGFPPPGFAPPQPNPFYAQAPIYYPPPPRQPILKPEQTRFLKQLLVTIILIGTLFLIVIVGVQQLSDAFQRVTQDQERDKTEALLTAKDNGNSAEQKIAMLEKNAARYRTRAEQDRYRRLLGAFNEQAGKDMIARNDRDSRAKANEYFLKTVELDPSNSAGYSDLAMAIYQQGMAQSGTSVDDAKVRATAFREAADYWCKASQFSHDQADKASFGTYAATAALALATEVMQYDLNMRDAAQQSLMRARQYVADNSPAAAQIQQALAQIH